LDPGLVERARQGDQEAFAEIVARSIGRLNGVARLLLHDPYAAEDAVQEALVDAWRDLPRLRDPARFDAWLRRLLVHACYDRARRDRNAAVVRLAEPPDRADDHESQPGIIARDEVERALRTISVEHQAALVLTYYLDLSLAEAAATLGIPIGTMKSRLDRARSALRAALSAQDRVTVAGKERIA
jgi:RNA polymerase sigma-70 factor (ECF subfamily)